MKTAIVIGSSGLVGSELVKQLEHSKQYAKVILLNRRHTENTGSIIEERIINFDAPDLSGIQGEELYCAIGTTIRKAGSKEKQYKIDCDYPSTLARLLKDQGVKKFLLVSSIGANAGSSNFYLRTKGQLERNIESIGFDSVIILRPSFILGHRKEFRLGEKIGIVLMKVFSPFLVGGMKKYRGVKASAIASKMVNLANQDLKGIHIIESDKI